MIRGIQFIPDNVSINFLGMRYIAFVLSAILVIASITLVVQKGLNFGIDFTGGTVIEIKTPITTPDLANMRTMLDQLNLGAISIQTFGEPDDILIRLPQQEGGNENQQVAIEKVKTSLDVFFEEGGAVDYRRVEYVGPQVGEELKKAGFFAVLYSLGGILIYITFRFEWQFGLCAIVALAHDAFAILGLYAVFGLEFNLTAIVGILITIGYSINDTVVIYDRIRENLRKYKKKPVLEIINKSINETLTRTILTSSSTLLALFSLYFF
jgi:preprotein translocase subunit SecF